MPDPDIGDIDPNDAMQLGAGPDSSVAGSVVEGVRAGLFGDGDEGPGLWQRMKGRAGAPTAESLVADAGRGAARAQPQQSAVSHDEIADHRALVAYLRKEDPNASEDLLRRMAANIVVDPNSVYRPMLEKARAHAAPPPNMNYLQDTQRRLAQAHQQKNVADPYYREVAQKLSRQQPFEDTYPGSDYDQQQAWMQEQQHFGEERPVTAQEKQRLAQGQQQLNRRAGQPAQPQQPDPQAMFMEKTAPLAARLVRKTGLDPMSAALIAAQLYGAKPYTDQLSDAEISTGVNQALGQLTGPTQTRKQ